jgi:hypothetical protein
MDRDEQRAVIFTTVPRRIAKFCKPGTGGDRDPDHLYRTTPRETVYEWVNTLHANTEVEAKISVARRDRKRRGQLFSFHEQEFIRNVKKQADLSSHARPLTGKQLVMVRVLLDLLAEDTVVSLETE